MVLDERDDAPLWQRACDAVMQQHPKQLLRFDPRIPSWTYALLHSTCSCLRPHRIHHSFNSSSSSHGNSNNHSSSSSRRVAGAGRRRAPYETTTSNRGQEGMGE